MIATSEVARGEGQRRRSATVQSRSPSAIRSASGPWPETESPTRCPSRQIDQAQSAVSPSGTTVTATPSTRIPEPCASSQPRAPTRRPSRGSAVRARVGEEPADHPDREADHQGGRGRRDPAERRDQHQRTPVPGVGAIERTAGGRGRTGEQRSHGFVHHHPGGPTGSGLPRRFGVGCRGSGYRGWRHEGPGRVRPVLQGRPHAPAAADVLPDRRPPVLARRRPRRVRRHLAPLAQGLPLEDPEAWTRARCVHARRSAVTRPSSGTARRGSTPRSRRPSTRSASSR